jgi:hypothetical protein
MEMEKLSTDQQAKIDADQARREELKEEMEGQRSKFE